MVTTRLVKRVSAAGIAMACAWAFLLAPAQAWAQADDQSIPMAFEQFGTRSGLSQNTVLDVMQDSQGFIWVATESGLNRFDGQGFKVYFRQPHKAGGLVSDYIWDIEEDASGDLWLATTDAGLVRWNRATDSFESFLDESSSEQSELRRRVQTLLIASDGRIWVGTGGGGVFVLSRHGEKLAEYGHVPGISSGLKSNNVLALAEAENGDIWIGSQTGLSRMDAATGEVLHVSGDDSGGGPLPDTLISSLLFDSHGNLWIGTFDRGVFKMSANGEVLQYSTESVSSNRITHNHIRDILEDSVGQIWIATQHGLSVVNERGVVTRRSLHDSANRLSLANDYAMSLYEDTAGLIWVGTRGGGISRWNPRSMALGPRTPNWLSGTHVQAFSKAPNGGIYMATLGSGIARLDRNGRKLGFLEDDAVFASLQDRRIMSLLTDRHMNLWIGTFANALYCYEAESKTLRHYPAVEGATDAIGATGIMSIAEDDAGGVWVGTFNGGVAYIDPLTREVSRIGTQQLHPELFESRATAIATAPDGDVWVGTDGHGLFRLNRLRGTIERFKHDPNRPGSLPTNSIYALHLDPQGNVWLGTAGYGLVRLDRRSIELATARFTAITVADGLSSNVIYGIQPDGSGHFWLSGNNGLTRFDPDTGHTRLFHADHGLFGEEFNFGAHYRADDGRIYFGGTGGFNIVDPRLAGSDGTASRVILTSISTLGGKAVSHPPAYLLHQISLPHSVDAISLEYALMDFVAPTTNQYSTRLVGFEREWSEPTSRSRTTYTNLDAGEYVFQVRGANSDGIWSEVPYELRIAVLPAPWATWWAYAVYVAVFGGMLWFFLHLRFQEQERRARLNQLVYYDAVTGMPNRELFVQRADEGHRRATDKQQGFAVISVQVRMPQPLLAALGRQGHDDVLRAVSAGLARVVHSESSARARRDLARVDADEFAVSLRAVQAGEASERLAYQITQTLSEPLVVGGHSVPLTVSIGIALAPEHANDSATLLKYASAASSELVEDREGGVVLFDHDVTRRAADKLSLESRLRAAIRNNELELHYQPIYRVTDDVIVGAEALLRWRDGSRGWVSPGEFVALAEESRLIVELDTWVVKTACDRLAAWEKEGRPPTRISVNVSASNVQRVELITAFAEYCKEVGVNPASIQIEITESALLRDSDDVQMALSTLNEYGFGVALDDFGTGYSSLSHMKMLDISTVKIDRSFVDGIATDIDSLTICRAIIGLARGLDLKTVAEGVETMAQFDALKALGCDEMQGYLRSPAVPESAFLALLGAAASPETTPSASSRVVGPWKDSHPG